MAKKSASSLKLDSLTLSPSEIIDDYRVVYLSRQASLLGRKEVLGGKAKFGIFGDGKELAQIALAKAFRKGDWRSGYYRDQTFLMALNQLSIRQFFAQLYADPNLENEPASGGRQMNNHFASRYITPEGEWIPQTESYNIASDLSPTAGQMAKLTGLGYASKLYRSLDELKDFSKFSKNGDEVAFGTIGNASTSQGVFFETINAACVLKIPLVISVWDDDYGISVMQKYHTTKQSISAALQGFELENEKNKNAENSGMHISQVMGWDYEALVKIYQTTVNKVRKEHIPALIHVSQISQPLGHSTSGSHERYKSKERLEYERGIDCLPRFRAYILDKGFIGERELSALETETLAYVQSEKKAAWEAYYTPILAERAEFMPILENLSHEFSENKDLQEKVEQLKNMPVIGRRHMASLGAKILLGLGGQESPNKDALIAKISAYHDENKQRYQTYLTSESLRSPLHVTEIKPEYSSDAPHVDGRQIMNKYFTLLFQRDPRVFAIGEDIGFLGDVNLGFENIQSLYGELRCTDTGIREATILGQGIGAAMRGLRPIIEIQYLDYLLYCFQGLSDDLASLHYRTAGGQAAPLIIRTRGHRLEGIWHSGSPMGMIISGARGIHICVPRNMTQAAGMYETLMSGDDPGLIVEVLNGYRVKEVLPSNIGTYRIPLGVPEILRSGSDVTLVTYGACVKIAEEACAELEKFGINVELIDVQTLLPFDRQGIILASLQKTNAVIFLDEDVPGGATGFMLEQVLVEQKGYEFLDADPLCISASAHRSPYGSDGDYWSKPNAETIMLKAYGLMHERNPNRFPSLSFS